MFQRLLIFNVLVVVATGYLVAQPVKTSIVDAAEAADWAAVGALINKDSVASVQPDGMTALHWASFHGHAETARDLINAGAKVDATTRYEVSPLSLACSQGKSDVVVELLKAGADPNAKQPGGATPLLIASRTGDANTINSLLKHGAKINAAEHKGQTPLMWAAAEGNLRAVDALIDGGAELNTANRSGFTAMMFAARQGHQPIVARLLDAGVDINDVMKPDRSGARVPRKGTSALLMAVESGHFELAMFLIKNGADPNDQRGGFAPLHMIAGVRKPNRGEGTDGDPAPRGSGKLASMEFVREIIAAGADVNLKLKNGKSGRAVLNHTGATPMLLAAKTADLELMQTLVEHGADPLIPNVDGCTPLMACAGIGVRAVGEEAGTEPEVLAALAFLIDHGADANTVDKNKETAMHGAGYRCFPKVVEFLARNGAESKVWDHKNKWGWTPIDIGKGHRPGSFKPHPPTVAAMRAAMQAPKSNQ